MTSTFKYPFTLPILYDSKIDDIVFNELKKLLIDTIHKPIIPANLVFLTEMKNQYTVYREDILKYKNLYSYLKSQATKLYYQLCENHMMNFQRGFELHPERCWFFVGRPGTYVPTHTHGNDISNFHEYNAPQFHVNGNIYLTTFDKEKEINDPSNTSVMGHPIPNPFQTEYDDIDLMEIKTTGTSNGQLNINIKEGLTLTIFPKAKTGLVIDKSMQHWTNPFSSDQIRITFVYNNAYILPENTEPPISSTYTNRDTRHQYNLPSKIIDKIMRNI